MGTYARPKPARLAQKLLQIRCAFGDSQNGLLRRLGLADALTQSEISAYERGVREPPLYVILRYSEAARVWVNALIDDGIDLPEEIPSRRMSEGIKCPTPSKRKR
jgi:transcriptional regulator with XRE-family HTH domain